MVLMPGALLRSRSSKAQAGSDLAIQRRLVGLAARLGGANGDRHGKRSAAAGHAFDVDFTVQ
jgi:hypothetical protein